jgi:hypothetical protein
MSSSASRLSKAGESVIGGVSTTPSGCDRATKDSKLAMSLCSSTSSGQFIMVYCSASQAASTPPMISIR